MADLTLRLNVRISARLFRWGLAGLLLPAMVTELSSENVTLSTYYPAPSGVYTQMLTTGNTWLARDSGNVGVGTAAAISKLEINGTATIDNNASVKGSLGVGTSSLGPAGTLQFGNKAFVAGAACSSEGTFAYDYSNHVPIYCDNIAKWRSAKTSVGGTFTTNNWGACLYGNPLNGGLCSCPTGFTEHIIYAAIGSGTWCDIYPWSKTGCFGATVNCE